MQATRRKTVFISGSAYEYGRFGEDGRTFIRELSKTLLKNGFRIISGFGAGVGNYVVEGALHEIYANGDQNGTDQNGREQNGTDQNCRDQNNGNPKITDQLRVFPFPTVTDLLENIQKNYRDDIISQAGTAIFLFGNKLEDICIREADGMRKEFDIARSHQALLIPVGASGYISERLWQEMIGKYDDYFTSREKFELYEQLGNPEARPEDLIDTILQIAQ